jgi:hypothetical protein
MLEVLLPRAGERLAYLMIPSRGTWPTSSRP